MFQSNDPGRGGRLRTTGLALLAVALIAVVIGLVVALQGERKSARTSPLATPSHAPTATPSHPVVIPYPPPVPTTPAPAPETSASVPGQAAVGAELGDNGESRGAVRVYNNSTISGLAARAAADLRAAGWTVIEVGNYARSTIPTTTAYYREGTGERASADALRARFGAQVEPRFAEIANDGPGVILIVTNDYAG